MSHDSELDRHAVHQLLVKQRLHDLEMAYCRGIDRRDRELFRSVYFDDAVEDHGGMFQGPVEEFVDWVFGGFMSRINSTAHYVLNEAYRIDGDKAEGEIHRISYHRILEPGVDQRFSAVRSFSRYECRGGIWKIARRTSVRDWIVDTPQTVDLLGGQVAMSLSAHGNADRSYVELPLFSPGPID
ncbi:nuclear transport factor 2 family protein [Nocardia jiangxiensis]|uniref:Nuclear transport factor 2 family protein n=1 Tax=Nocardia jiangxiensis TaxID=282685 RepID=A0ABW6SG67_9NOCA